MAPEALLRLDRMARNHPAFSRVTPSKLLPIMGNSLDLSFIEWQGKLSSDDGRALIQGEQPYRIAVRDGQFAFVLDQRRVALAVARGVIRGLRR